MIKLFKLVQVSVAIYIAILVFTETEDNSAHYLLNHPKANTLNNFTITIFIEIDHFKFIINFSTIRMI